VVAVVPDASVTLAAVLRHQTHGSAARAVLRGVVQTAAVVPALRRLELGNILLGEPRRNRLSEAESAQTLDHVVRLAIRGDTLTEASAWDATMALAVRHRLTLYHATYPELALRPDLPRASLDRRLMEAALRAGVVSAILP
jgi:predicted nucleic acid-binding protein